MTHEGLALDGEMTEALFSAPDISQAIDCLLGLAIVVSVGLAVWTIWRHRNS